MNASTSTSTAAPIVSSVTLADLPPTALAGFQEAAEWFEAGHTITQAAADYAGSSDRYFARVVTWATIEGLLNLPARDGGKVPKFEAIATISSDSRNSARMYAQETVSLAWRVKNEKGLDPFAFASMSALRAAVRAKDKTLANATNEGGVSVPAEATEATDTPEAVKLEIAADDLQALIDHKAILAAVAEELAKGKPSIKALRDLVSGIVAAPAAAAV